MFNDLTTNQRLAVKKRAGEQLRKAGFTDLEVMEPHTLQWNELHERKKTLAVTARQLLDTIIDSTSELEAREIESAVDGLMAAHGAIQGELDTRGQLNDKSPRAHGGDTRRPIGEDMTVRGDGSLAGDSRSDVWRDKEGKEIRTYAPNERISQGTDSSLSFGGGVRALVFGARNEAEGRALSEGTNSAGGWTVPAPLASQFIDALRAQSVAIQSGAITVPMTSETLQIAKLASDPGFAWRAENAAVGGSDPTFSRVLFTAKSCAAIVKASREVLEDSVNVEQILMQAFAQAAALEIDRAALQGSGASDEPRGILNISGINEMEMGTNGAAFTDYDPWLDAIYELELDNVPGPYASAMHPRTARDLRKLKTGLSGDNTSLVMPPSVSEIARRITTTLPIDETQGTAENASSVIIGNFSQMMVGIRSDLRIEVLRERYADNNQIGFLAHFRMDIQVRHPEAFCAIKGVIPA
ncbi:phage major capsid protein [Marinimicrobium sp. ABcell2]|uniref:phage major capsid protein n=1 Tax=Marinimicrobium sp. ABcell2 TaxID=3069751 RepID=UPI0027B3C46F|nr:phage major capsid protein [Marinimicrobium sp. ABcell2]MDQ2077629.1 phage major capsid protein [Marinimicrobium sp. ABcell2]